MTPMLDTYYRERIVEAASGCWIWTGSLSSRGYGMVRKRGKDRNRNAHRVIYEMLVGPVAADLELDHLCRVRSCVRPSHLDPVPGRINTLRGQGFAAVNARKTHCGPCGRPLEGSNLIVDRRNNRRRCAECTHKNTRERQARHRAKRRGQLTGGRNA